tara:strand:+ start:1014 stop:1220 length:207 start_codon:yes stop_codon:yes gene_type:complete
MDSLFNIEPTKPTPLQSARRALADAERELAKAEEEKDTLSIDCCRRAVNRFEQLCKAEELAELERSKK